VLIVEAQEVIEILEVANISPEQSKKILTYCYKKEVDATAIMGYTYKLPLPEKLYKWLKKKAGIISDFDIK
jgi:hypothetical protein